MPYIVQERRAALEPLAQRRPDDVGELTFQVSSLLAQFLEGTPPGYAALASCIAALEGAKADLVARVLTPYEQRKAAENGDVWRHVLAAWRLPCD